MSHPLVALLRGVNVGGSRPLPMAALRDLCASLGWEDVRTYIQSGNVVFRAPDDDRERQSARLASVIADRFGYDVPVVIRAPEELQAALDEDPFLADGADPARLHVAFLAARPAEEAVARLDPDRSPPDAFRVIGDRVHLHWPNRGARTRLTLSWLERQLGVPATARNRRTLQQLVALSGR